MSYVNSGNDNMYYLTTNNDRQYRLRVDLTADTGVSKYAEYSFFTVNNETDNYRMHIGEYCGSAGEYNSYMWCIWWGTGATTQAKTQAQLSTSE